MSKAPKIEHTYSLRISGIIGALIYLALGLAVYMWLGDYTVFMWTDPWVFVYMLLWPLILFFKALYWALIIVAAVAVIWFLVLFVEGRRRRNIRKHIVGRRRSF